MSKKLFRVLDSDEIDFASSLSEVKDCIVSFFEETCKCLGKPIIFGVNLVDLLFLKNDGKLIVVKILDQNCFMASFGKLISDYSFIQNNILNFKDMYPNENIVVDAKIEVVFFLPNVEDAVKNILSFVSFPCEFYQYEFVSTDTDEGISFRKLSDSLAPKLKQDYSSILKIMGENVRSETSSKEASSEVVPRKDALSAQDVFVDTSEQDKENEKLFETLRAEVGFNPINSNESFLDRRKLSEEELVAFFDLEKKIDAFIDTQYS